jgi:hypothetical protein
MYFFFFTTSPTASHTAPVFFCQQQQPVAAYHVSGEYAMLKVINRRNIKELEEDPFKYKIRRRKNNSGCNYRYCLHHCLSLTWSVYQQQL